MTGASDSALYTRSKQAAYRRRSKAQVAAKRTEMHPTGLRPCGKCHEHKPFEAFNLDRSRPDGLRYVCRECMRGIAR